MSSTIWMRCGGISNFTEFSKQVWRVVEVQHKNSTRRLVDTDEEQHILENLIDDRKPPLPKWVGPSLHYLLFTPFRYRPLRRGSRYGRSIDPGVWYGAESVETCFAEVAYYRFVFADGTDADLDPIKMELSAFSTPVKCIHAVDVTVPPFDKHEAALTSKTTYAATQALGAAMRSDGTHIVRYRSARDVSSGSCVGIFNPIVFTRPRLPPITYRCSTTRSQVTISGGFGKKNVGLVFEREQFEINGKLPSPATT